MQLAEPVGDADPPGGGGTALQAAANDAAGLGLVGDVADGAAR
jgi:hypothetical protein